MFVDGGRGDNIVSDSSGKGLIIGLPIAIDTNFVAARAATVYNSYSACEYSFDFLLSIRMTSRSSSKIVITRIFFSVKRTKAQ